MKFQISILYLSVLFCCQSIAQDSAETRILQPVQMQQDFNYLRMSLEDTHPGLYMHHTRDAMQYKMDSLYNLLDKPVGFLDFYKIIAYLIAEIKCEHTYCNPYSNDYNNRMVQWKLIPMQFFFSKGRAYVAVNRTSDPGINLGDELLSINHQKIDSIERAIFKYLPSDGNMESSKESALSSMAFSIYYYLFIERPDAFEMVFKNTSGQIFTKHFSTALRMAENNSLAVSNPANKEILAVDKKQTKIKRNPWRIELFKEKNAAIITLNTFGGDRGKLFKLYDSFFATLKKEKIENLIIDLSYNDGGDEEYACELLSYLIKSPARFIESEYLINIDSSYLKISNLPNDILENKYAFIDTIKDHKIFVKALTKYSLELKTFEPKANAFKGKVYFYVNGGTSSAASTCTANAQSHGLATIVGDETAGCFAGGGSTNGLDLILPNSGITAHTSILYCKFSTEGKDKDRGVIPDYVFIPTFRQLIDGNDSWRNFIFDKINNK